MSNTKWKNGLLKTGLPLEYVAANILNDLEHNIFGEYPYIRPDETGSSKEFSIDIRTHKCIDSEDRLFVLDMLVECKYRQPETNWIFSPYPSDTMPIGLIHSTEDLVPIRLHGESVWEFEESIGYCVNGIELVNNGSGNKKGAMHGVFQLRYGMPTLLKNNYEHTIDHTWSNGRDLDFLCPILVTTADLRVIKPSLELENFTLASELDDITEIREAVILNERPGPQLQEFANSLAEEFINNRPYLQDRLQALDKFLVGKEWESRQAPDIDTITRSFENCTERVLIINYNSLKSVLKKLEGALIKDISTEKVYAKAEGRKENFTLVKLDS
ncbi:MAG: hypothetical protein WD037_03840 [Balneolales bacterium]